MQDKVNKNRQAKGENIGIARLKAEDIPQIVDDLLTGKSKKSVASNFGVSRKTINDIWIGRTWQWALSTESKDAVRRHRKSKKRLYSSHLPTADKREVNS